ncbi:MAG: ISAs1 family transposase [Actinomycetota bacterium]|nr:ISAs1 family transposase [Actinomycetota bacterium]
MISSLTQVLERHSTTPSAGITECGYAAIDSVSLRAALEKVPVPRGRRGVRYPFAGLLLILVCAVFSAAQSLTMIAEGARHAARTGSLFASGRVPSLATIHRLAAQIDPVALDDAVCAWVRDQTGGRGTRPVVAVDGKEARGAKNGGGTRVFLMAALDHATGTVIGQESIGEKTNEIPHFATLMGRLGDLSGVTITADALHTQREHAEYLNGRGAHYVLTVKKNQRALRNGSARRPGPPAGPSTPAVKKGMDARLPGRSRRNRRRTGLTSRTRNKRFA